MSLPFSLTAMSRLDGSAEDGIHLLWTAPPAIGYSLDGYDIQRRNAKDRSRPSCHTLTEDELETLHRTARLEYRFGTIGVQLTKCPEFPTVAPDAPFQITAARAQATVFDFSRTAIDKKPNPRKEAGVQFLVRDREGRPDNFTRIRATGVHAGLDCGFELEITLLNPSAVVKLELAHFAEAPTVEALNAAGREVDKAISYGLKEYGTSRARPIPKRPRRHQK